MNTRKQKNEHFLNEDEDQNRNIMNSLQNIMQQLESINKKQTDFDKRQDNAEKTLNEIKGTIDTCIENSMKALEVSEANKQQIKCIQAELDNEKTINTKLNAKMSKIEERLIYIESQSRRDNLLLDGEPESGSIDNPENCTDIIRDFFKTKLKLDNVDKIQIVRCHRLGPKKVGNKKPRTLIVKFQWFGDRQRVWSARKMLKDSKYFLNEDFPKEIQYRRRTLRPIMQKAKALGMEAYLTVDTLVVSGKKYTINDLNKLPIELNPARVATPHIGDIVCFFGGMSPLSNFHMCDFQVDGITYDCEERHYTRRKALFVNDIQAVEDVMLAETPYDVKRIGNRLNININQKEWHMQAQKVMMDGIKCKFGQNEHLRKFLLETGDKQIVETNPYDNYWSCGLSMKDSTKLQDRDNWPGANNLGTILTNIRDSLKD